ncbi:MAG: hypothetical protein M1822_000828 [Bathelium mastoideum]|nr:MAG: hypothetical protein M1822_000828 [Bathelium mastoideum]
MASTLPRSPLFEALTQHDPNSTAIIHSLSGRSFTYGELLKDVAEAKDNLSKRVNGRELAGERVALLVENGYDYVVTLLSIFASYGIAVPMSPEFPAHELQYVVNHSRALAFLSSSKFHGKAEQVVKEGLDHGTLTAKVEKILQGRSGGEAIRLEDAGSSRGGMMLYTSGTTSRPKGVFLSESVLTAQARSLHQAWHYSPEDYLLHPLPLHHIHGTVNALLTPLLAGSTIEFMFPFNATRVWERLAAPFLPNAATTNGTSTTLPSSSSDATSLPPNKRPITFFTVVPTIYNRLLASHPSLPEPLRTASRTAISPTNLRLAISGSAALPTPTRHAWTALSGGNTLLERYGMTEVGMALSCGLDAADRVDGSVGWPLPEVEARLVDTESGDVISVGEEVEEVDGARRERQGEIQLRGPTIFAGYWDNEEATRREFVDGEDGKGRWFRTGDVAVRRPVTGAGQGRSGEWAKGPMYFIQGRKSADIIKTGGEKVSALEVEREMLALEEVEEVAVVALLSEQWGQKVAAVVMLSEQGKSAGKGGKAWGPLDMRRALKERLAAYKIPQEMKVVESIPRNAMGKSKFICLTR